ncbi:MAG: ABC transporter ATP-binding protein [Pirellulales bacterium]|nr:ABC transporter ATP-binding protein [Pirellulales bacterium]
MSDVVIECDQLSRKFGANQALDSVTLCVRSGSVFGLVGENGAGKTTLIRHILGLLRAEQGSVQVFQLDPVQHPKEVLGRIGYLSEDRDLPDWMSCSQFMRYSQAFYPNWDEAYAEHLRDKFGLDPMQPIKHLSRGQRARIGLLAAVAHRPDLLILDEPSSGLDPAVRRDILSAIIRTVADEGRTVLFSSHLLEEVERVADRVTMIHNGRLELSGSLPEILQRHHRIVLHFDSLPPTQPEFPGALSCQGSGREWTVLCNGGVDELRATASKIGAQIVEEGTPSLDEIFLARTESSATHH